MMALTGILLSSTILGASTTNVQASSNKALSVDKTEIANNVIQVINELLNSSSTASNVNSQTKFSDLTDGKTMTVAPIFGQKTKAQFDKVLQGELNVVDDNEQLVSMTSNGDGSSFPTTVKYTLDGVTKTVNVDYSFSHPYVTFTNNSQVMNFKSTDDQSVVNSKATATDLVKVNSSNGVNINGDPNKTSVTSSGKIENGKVTFTPTDSYVNDGKIAATRTINTYSDPDWSTLPNSVKSADTKVVISDKNNDNHYLVDFKTDASNSNILDVTGATVIDALGNTVVSDATGDSITFTNADNKTVDINSNAKPMLVFKLAKTDRTVYTAPVAATTMTIADIQKTLPDGYTLTSSAANYNGDGDKTYEVTKSADTTINYVNTLDGTNVGTEQLTGNNGDSALLTQIPSGYKLVDETDLFQKLSALTPDKTVYVKPKADSNTLSYTVTFRDKTTGKVVGTESKGTGEFGTYVGVTAPDGYALSTVIDHGFILLKNDQKVTKYVVAADTPYNVSFVDQDTGKEVGTQAGKGANDSKIVLSAPEGYAFVSADDVNYTIDKDTPSSTVYVQKSNQTVDNIVSGYPRNGNIKIYDANGKLNDDVVLSEGSSWIIDKTVTINGAEYYRVATDQYVKASDVYKYTPLQTIAVTNGTNVTPVYNSRGQLIIDRALDVNTPWYTDRSATIKGQKMYRVATDEWIKASDSTLR